MENPAYLLGFPLLLLGAVGLTVAFSIFFMPEDGAASTAIAGHGGHPTVGEYVIIGIVLAAITTVEVALFYVEGIQHNLLIVMLMALSALKFMLVVGFFMHLKSDAKVLSVFFFGAFALAFALFIVVTATLGSNLV
jgi:cytochrome c oxidase subunit 4